MNGEVWARRNKLEDEETDSEEIEVEKPLDKHKIAFQQLRSLIDKWDKKDHLYEQKQLF